jgi:hypothetical protein
MMSRGMRVRWMYGSGYHFLERGVRVKKEGRRMVEREIAIYLRGKEGTLTPRRSTDHSPTHPPGVVLIGLPEMGMALGRD